MEKESTARIGRSERGLRRERRKGLDEGGKLGGSRFGKWNRRSEGCVVQASLAVAACLITSVSHHM